MYYIPKLLWQICNICWTDESHFATMRQAVGRVALLPRGRSSWRCKPGAPPARVRVIVRATACSVMLLAALVLFGTAGVLSPAAAQVKAPTKSKLKPCGQGRSDGWRRRSTQCQMAAGERPVRRLQAG